MAALAVYPGFFAVNYSPYLEGLAEIYGRGALKFTKQGFPSFQQHCLAFIIQETGARIFIDAQDWPLPADAGLEWADLYAKVNLDPARIPPAYMSKVVAAGPSFPMKISGAGVWWPAIRNYWIARSSMEDPRRHFSNWRAMDHFALPERRYSPSLSSADYAFFCGSIWKNEPECNEYRSRYIQACRSLNWLTFEGGFAPRAKRDVPGFEALTAERRYPHAEWLMKTQQSAVVFNTPAVYGSLAWKLPEYLALGKAIISTPLLRSLTAPLVHGEHIHYVDGSVESMKEAVERICRDDRYRTKLGRGARAYYLQHLQPARAVGRIIELATKRVPIDESRPIGDAAPYDANFSGDYDKVRNLGDERMRRRS